MAKTLFDFDYSLKWPDQEKFPINEDSQGFQVRNVLNQDIKNTESLIIITGFTSLSNLIEVFGTTDYAKLRNTKIVIGFDVDERVGKKLVHYSLQSEIKEFWLKQGVSIKLCGPIINIIEKIKNKEICFKIKKRLHAKIYVSDRHAMLGSSNFSKSGLIFQREANIRVDRNFDIKELYQYEAIKQVAENYYEISDDYNNGIVELLSKLLKDATWEEALARSIAEILENKWMRDFSVLYQALINKELWPSQKIGIARAMSIIQDRGNVLLADPTGSGKTKFATTLAFTLFHWLGENGYKDRSNALIIAPKQVVENWEQEQGHFNILNKIESMGKLSNSKGKSIEKLQKEIEKIDILLIDEAHNYLNWKSRRSLRIKPKRSAHIILSTATPINKNPNDLLRLIELLDIDNLSDNDLETYCQLRKQKKNTIDGEHLNKLKNYVNQFIVRRTKRELNKMIEREPSAYKNRNGHNCRYPKANPEIYTTGETLQDKEIANKINHLIQGLKGVNYLQKLDIPPFFHSVEEKKGYLIGRFKSAPALASFEVKSALRSSHVALYERINGTKAACKQFEIETTKLHTGDIINTITNCMKVLPKRKFPDEWLPSEHHWILSEANYRAICEKEIEIYQQIANLCLQFSGQRERSKAKVLIEQANRYKKVLAFDSTVITLDYLKHLLEGDKSDIQIIVATGQNERNKRIVRDNFSIINNKAENKLIALCSDAMSEGINLPSAKAMVLLDMPSVLRIIEQRIGRLERMDSEHKEIHVFWPDDSDEFSLNGDKRIIEILILAGNILGSNVDIPEVLYKRFLENGIKVGDYIKAYEEFSAEELEWQGVKDSTQNLYSLMEGENALIDLNTYNEFKDVDATVKSAISFIESDKKWSFFAFRGDSVRSPKWLFIDEQNKTFTDFSEIAEKLKLYLRQGNIQQRKWSEVDTQGEIKKLVRKLKLQELGLLPEKKKRALKVAEKILRILFDKTDSKNEYMRKLIRNLLDLFNPETNIDLTIDYDNFAEVWLTILQPALDEKRRIQKKRIVMTLRDLTHKDVPLDEKILLGIYESCQGATTLDTMIAACIISITK